MNSTKISALVVVSIALTLVLQSEAFVPGSLRSGKRDKMSIPFARKEVNLLFCGVD